MVALAALTDGRHVSVIDAPAGGKIRALHTSRDWIVISM